MLKHVEELAPSQQKTRLELVVEGTRLGMWDWNPQTGEVIFDERWAQMLGYDLSEIEQSIHEWEERVHPDDIAACFQDIQDHMSGKSEFYENIHRMKHRSGKWIYILDRGKVVERDEAGNPVRFTGTHTDITREKEAELKALEAMNAKSAFMANMSHEIRTPLNGILGLLQLLQETSLDTQQRKWVETISDCGEGLLTIINDILDLSKIETGKITIEAVHADVSEVFNLVYHLFQEKAQTKNLDYTLEISEDLPPILFIDAQRVKQIALNLISNAIKFTKQGSVAVVVHGEKYFGQDLELVVEVIDTGKGIANPQVIWERFSQEDNSISREFGGTGLGLSISKNFATMMGGTLEVSSEVGKGSTFCLRFPCKRGERKNNDDNLTENPIFLPEGVLVAEDNHVNQMVIGQVLQNLGLKPTIVPNGEAAVEACEKEAFDLIFMDLRMPKMNGIEATKIILSNPATLGAPSIVALTADTMTESIQRCKEAGMVDFVYKPFRIAEIVSVIARTGEMRRAMNLA